MDFSIHVTPKAPQQRRQLALLRQGVHRTWLPALLRAPAKGSQKCSTFALPSATQAACSATAGSQCSLKLVAGLSLGSWRNTRNLTTSRPPPTTTHQPSQPTTGTNRSHAATAQQRKQNRPAARQGAGAAASPRRSRRRTSAKQTATSAVPQPPCIRAARPASWIDTEHRPARLKCLRWSQIHTPFHDAHSLNHSLACWLTRSTSFNVSSLQPSFGKCCLLTRHSADTIHERTTWLQAKWLTKMGCSKWGRGPPTPILVVTGNRCHWTF